MVYPAFGIVYGMSLQDDYLRIETNAKSSLQPKVSLPSVKWTMLSVATTVTVTRSGSLLLP